MKKFLTLLFAAFLAIPAFSADAANDVVLSQRKADNSGFIQRNVAPVTNGFLTFDASKVPTSPDITYSTPTLTVPAGFGITGAGSLAFTAGGSNQNITLTPSGTGYLNVPGANRTILGNPASIVGANASAIFNILGSSGVQANLSRSSNDASGSIIAFFKDRLSGGVVQNGDEIGFIDFRGSYDASLDVFNRAALIYATVDGAVSGTSVPGKLDFWTTPVGGSATSRMTINADGSVRLPSTNTAGLQLYNTVDQVTNYSRLQTLIGASNAEIGTATAGTGTGRILSLYSQGSLGGLSFTRLDLNNAALPILRLGLFTSATGTTLANSTAPGTFFSLGSYTNTATSGTVINTAITPTYNQASGTAANTDLLINRTQTAVGSGAQLLIDAQVGSASQFSVSNGGAIVASVQALSGAGAVNVTQTHTDYTSTGGAQALTLANGTAGQIKTICHVTDGGSGVLTPTTKTGFTTITFTNAGDSVTLRYSATGGWYIVGIFGAVAA